MQQAHNPSPQNQREGAVGSTLGTLGPLLCWTLLIGCASSPPLQRQRPLKAITDAAVINLQQKTHPQRPSSTRPSRRPSSASAAHSGGVQVRDLATSQTSTSTTRVKKTPPTAKCVLSPPYPLRNIFRGFGPCVAGRQRHPAMDIGGVGPHYGLGSPVRSMVRAEVVFVGRSREAPRLFGTLDRRKGWARRGRKGRLRLPRSLVRPGYGRVYFFTRQIGRWRTGNIVITRSLEPSCAGMVLRYMHLGAARPDLRKGSVLARGEELGLMGGTAVQTSPPHVHVDITDSESGRRLDVARMLGMEVGEPACDKIDTTAGQ